MAGKRGRKFRFEIVKKIKTLHKQNYRQKQHKTQERLNQKAIDTQQREDTRHTYILKIKQMIKLYHKHHEQLPDKQNKP